MPDDTKPTTTKPAAASSPGRRRLKAEPTAEAKPAKKAAPEEKLALATAPKEKPARRYEALCCLKYASEHDGETVNAKKGDVLADLSDVDIKLFRAQKSIKRHRSED